MQEPKMNPQVNQNNEDVTKKVILPALETTQHVHAALSGPEGDLKNKGLGKTHDAFRMV